MLEIECAYNQKTTNKRYYRPRYFVCGILTWYTHSFIAFIVVCLQWNRDCNDHSRYSCLGFSYHTMLPITSKAHMAVYMENTLCTFFFRVGNRGNNGFALYERGSIYLILLRFSLANWIPREYMSRAFEVESAQPTVQTHTQTHQW